MKRVGNRVQGACDGEVFKSRFICYFLVPSAGLLRGQIGNWTKYIRARAPPNSSCAFLLCALHRFSDSLMSRSVSTRFRSLCSELGRLRRTAVGEDLMKPTPREKRRKSIHTRGWYLQRSADVLASDCRLVRREISSKNGGRPIPARRLQGHGDRYHGKGFLLTPP